MHAVVVTTYGGPEQLEYVDLPTPEPASNEVRIAVTAAAVNPVDPATRAGYLERFTPAERPIGLGWDVAGRIDTVGTAVTEFRSGDRVVAIVDHVAAPSGAYAEFVVLPATAVAHAPTSADDAAASTLPLNGLSAAQALDLLDLAAGQTLLVTGAAGSLGGYALGLAAGRGLRVVGLAGAADESFVRAAGADEFIARGHDVATAVRRISPDGVDGVIDGAGLGSEALAYVRDGGSFAALNDPTKPDAERDITVHRLEVHRDGERLAELVGLVDSGRLELRVAATLPLREAAEAHRQIEKGGVRGRIVLVP
jgi:NADPH:quinone reductase